MQLTARSLVTDIPKYVDVTVDVVSSFIVLGLHYHEVAATGVIHRDMKLVDAVSTEAEAAAELHVADKRDYRLYPTSAIQKLRDCVMMKSAMDRLRTARHRPEHALFALSGITREFATE